MRNYIDELPPQVYLPLKYLDEVKSAPQAKLGFPYFWSLLFSQDHTGMAKQTDEAARIMRTDLIRNQQWQPANLYPILAFIIARLAAKTTGLTELARNDEWLGIMIGVTQMSVAAAHALRASWPWWTRWVARYMSPPVKKAFADRARTAGILQPILEKRVAALYTDNEKVLKPNDAAIYSSTAILLSVLYDLIDKRYGSVKSELLARVTRAAKVPYTFKDGLHLPEGTMIQLLHSRPQTDAELFEDPETFDPWRSLKKRQEGDPNKFQFASPI
ncbi:hypothetical protein B0T14DRAFT_499373 [Immersiella caudata]|uniref:Cytochrome P450 n=1 Tax=Immersiella caudata TaxID=314043 RepID=A0AA39WEN1_9PEZI|nr:hypothetical protein B0T14DRAFT_499373 [Immersiella caudata]